MELELFLKSIKTSYPSVSKDDTETIISEVLRIPKLDLMLNKEKNLTKSEITEIDLMLFKRAENEPLQYIFGETHFRNLTLKIGEGGTYPETGNRNSCRDSPFPIKKSFRTGNL